MAAASNDAPGRGLLERENLARDPLPLQGITVLVTGVSRREGIGAATARRLAAYGASVCCHHYAPHDAAQPWGSDDVDSVIDEIRSHLVGDARVTGVHANLADPSAPARLLDAALEVTGRVDALVANQALSGSDGTLASLTAEQLDAHWAVDARASLLLAQAFAAHHNAVRPGAIVLVTSGQGLGPMPGEVAYAAAKAALAGVTATLAAELAERRIRVNTVNPGPVDSGWMTPEIRRDLEPRFPFGRVGQPDDPARLVAWLLTDEAAWITGQIINSEGGFRR